MKKKLKYRIAFPLTAMVVGLLIATMVGSFALQTKQTDDMLREQAYILSQEMSAVWDFVAVNQERINRDADGSYNFKGLHCSIAGTSVGALFSSRTDYVIRYVSDVPRNPQNLADEFEAAAIEAFRANDSLSVYDGYTPMRGDETYYRYVIPLEMNSRCAECHGFPAGEVDVTGFPREGFSNGELVGVASISIPTAMYEQAAIERVLLLFGLGLLLIAGCLVTVLFVATRYVTRPLEKIEYAIRQTGSGASRVRLDARAIKAKDEMASLVEHFNETAERLEQLYASLEDQVAQRTEQLAAANEKLGKANGQLEAANEQLAAAVEQLEQADRYKSHYFTMMSHELKTPLTAIKAYADMLRDMGAVEDAAARDVLGKIQANVTALTKLVKNILEMSKLDAGKVELDRRPVDAVDVTNALSKALDPLAQSKGVNLYFAVAADMPLFMADQDKVLHILENLGSNAVKYSPKGGSVVISAYPCKKDATVRFAVTDEGPGVPDADRELIFEKFKQSRSSMEKPVSGSGLGLALAKEYAELHGGYIKLKSELGQGSTFKVVLPCEVASYAEEGEDYGTHSDS